MPLSITLSETYYNMERIKILEKVDTSHPEYDLENMMWPTEQKKLTNIVKKSKKNVNTISYKQPSYGVGRYYPTPYKSSYQSMYNVIRRLVLDGKATSLDIVNAHPIILKQTLEKFSPGFKKPYLDWYVNEREDFLNLVIEAHGATRKQAKGLLIRMSFGGSYKELCKVEKNQQNRDNPCKLIVGYEKEAQEIQNDIAPNKFPEFNKFTKIAKKENAKKIGKKDERTAIALYLQDWEAKIILWLYDYAISELGYTVEALIHDEILIRGDVEKELESNMNDIYFRIYKDTTY